MRTLLSRVALVAAALLLVVSAAATAGPGAGDGPAGSSVGTYFGDGNLPPGCIRDMNPDNPENRCYHMRTGLNALDSPQIDVLILAPVSPTVERDMRIMRQVVQMWEGGLEQLAEESGMDWLNDADFHITVDSLDGEFTTYPIYDPEIVVVATNPVGGVGIGIDPSNFASQLQILDGEGVPCTNIKNPFDIETWQALPGWDSHHEPRSGIYVEDCGGAGGNVCFAINGAIDPVPGTTDVFGIFDLISHEFGHCLTLGHVGDGAEGAWGVVPTNDIMSYSEDPPGISKCVSTLDLEGFALRMSNYLDRNGDGKVTKADRLKPNDVPGDGANSFQVQSPADHLYATDTGSPLDCPQPDVGLVPGESVDWGPAMTRAPRPTLDLDAVRPGSRLRISGTASYRPRGKQPTAANGFVVDDSGDALSPFNDLRKLSVKVTHTSLEATLAVGQLWPTTNATSPAAYSIVINGHRFDSFIAPGDSSVTTWDNGLEVVLPGVSSWDTATNTVRFSIPRRYLRDEHLVEAPYWISSQASVQNGKRLAFVDDRAPDAGKLLGVTGAPLADTPQSSAAFEPPLGTRPYKVNFGSKDTNRFAATNSNAGETLVADNHVYSMRVRTPSKVELTLDWDDAASELDLLATPDGADGSASSDNGHPEKVVLPKVSGLIDLEVVPFLVGATGTHYTLTATVTPLGKDRDRDGLPDPGDSCPSQAGPLPTGCPDKDADGIADRDDRCPTTAGTTATGCPTPASEWIRVYVDGELVRTARLDRIGGVGDFKLTVPGARAGRVKVVWANRSGALASASRAVR